MGAGMGIGFSVSEALDPLRGTVSLGLLLVIHKGCSCHIGGLALSGFTHASCALAISGAVPLPGQGLQGLQGVQGPKGGAFGRVRRCASS